MTETGHITMEELHEQAGVPEDAEVLSYDWVEDGLEITYREPSP